MQMTKSELAVLVVVLLFTLSIVAVVSSSAVSAFTGLSFISAILGQIEKAKEAIFAGSGEVLHVILRRSGGSLEQDFYVVEIWLDETRGNSRAVFRDSDGNRIGEILIRGNKRYDSANIGPAPGTEFIAADTENAILKGVGEQLWRYKWLLEKGQATVVWSGVIDGRRVLRVEVYPACCDNEKVVALVDEETKLPLTETTYRNGQEISTIISTYEVIERIKRSDLPAGTFESDIPRNVHRTIQQLTLEQARNFTEFDLYYLGEKFDGLQVQYIQHYKSYRVFQHICSPPRNEVMIVYGAPGWVPVAGSSPEIYVTIESATPDEIKEWQQCGGREIQHGVLRPTNYGGYRKEFLFGQSLVTLWAPAEDEITKMERALQKLR